VLSQIEMPEKRGNFAKHSNQIVGHLNTHFNPDILDDCRSARIGLRLMNNYQAQGELIGLDFSPLWYSIAVLTWFKCVLRRSRIRNRSDMTKILNKRANTFRKTGVYSNIDIGMNHQYRSEFLEHERAYNIFNQWRLATYRISRYNQQMKYLLIQNDDIHKEWNKSIEPDAGFHRICRFCMSGFNVKTSSDKWKSCGSPDCKRVYIRASRHKNHPKRGWIYDPAAQQPCIGSSIKTCGSNRKQLNSNRVCFGCYEPFS
jgi:hypothetical protein